MALPVLTSHRDGFTRGPVARGLLSRPQDSVRLAAADTERTAVTDDTAHRVEPGPNPLASWCSALYEGHPHAVLVVDASGHVLHANPAAGWLGTVPGRRLLDLLPAPGPERSAPLDEALHAGTAWTGTLDVRAADGSLPTVCLRLLAAQRGDDSDGARVCIVERHGLTDRLPALLWSVDTEFGCTWVNHAVVVYTGLAPEELLGPRWLECVHPQDRERCLGIFKASQDANLPFSLDLRLRRHDAAYRCHLVQATPLGSGYGGVSIDIEERHQLETQLAEHIEMRRRNDIRQGQFLSSLTHELRSPLAPISNAASVLRTLESDNPTLLRLREILERQVARMGRVLDDLIDVTQALQGELTLVRKPVLVNEVLEAALGQNQRSLDALRQQVKLSLPARAIVIEGDSVRLAQMLSSLLANASKFSPEATTIGVSVSAFDERLRIGVKDSGRGIAAGFLSKVFDLFAQETREPRRGLGVGLTLARRIAQYHGGDIVAHSAGLGEGAEFVVTLPLAPAVLRQGASRSASAKSVEAAVGMARR